MQKSVEIIEFEHAKTGSRHTLAMLLIGFAGVRLHCLSREVKTSIDGGLINDHQV
jgi:hypothetical protein